MNIENLKNMPVAGESIMVQVATAISAFQRDLKADEKAAITSVGNAYRSQIADVRQTQKETWYLGVDSKNARENNEKARRADLIADMQSHGASEVARLLGTDGVAATNTVLGLVETLRVEDADWAAVLTTNFTTVSDAQDAYFEAIGANEDIDSLVFE